MITTVLITTISVMTFSLEEFARVPCGLGVQVVALAPEGDTPLLRLYMLETHPELCVPYKWPEGLQMLRKGRGLVIPTPLLRFVEPAEIALELRWQRSEIYAGGELPRRWLVS